MVNEKLIIERLELIKKNWKKNNILRKEQLCFLLDNLIEYINGIKTDEKINMLIESENGNEHFLDTLKELADLLYIKEQNAIQHIESQLSDGYLDLGLHDKIELEIIREAMSLYKSDRKKNNKHGHWFLLDYCSNEGAYCSVCHKKVYKKFYANQKIKSKFCPNCGAIMDENFVKC